MFSHASRPVTSCTWPIFPDARHVLDALDTMDQYTLSPLPPILDSDPFILSKKIPQFPPLFKLPPLEDRPQNPIFESIRNVRVPLKEWSTTQLQISEEQSGKEETDERDIWLDEQVISNVKPRQVCFFHVHLRKMHKIPEPNIILGCFTTDISETTLFYPIFIRTIR